MAESGKIFVISGPSGVGKGTLCDLLIKKDPSLRLSISATSRPIRPSEKEGENYFFLNRDEFEHWIRGEKLLEWAEYNGHYYGTPREKVEDLLAKGHHVLLEIETQGALQVKARFPKACLIFLKPPSMNELKRRLQHRNINTDDDIEARLAIAEKELTLIDEFHHCILNDDLETCYQRVREVIQGSFVH